MGAVWRWLENQTAEDLFPREAAHELSASVRASAGVDAAQASLIGVIDQVEYHLRREHRTPRDILGAETADDLRRRLGDLVASSNGAAMESFVRSPQVGSIIGALLYETLFDFVRSSNLIGQFVRGLPLIGPIQDQIDSTAKFFLDRELGSNVKRFIGDYASTATERIWELTDTPENRRSFGNLAGRILDREFLDRPLAQLVPDEATAGVLKDVARHVLEPNTSTPGALVDFVYDGLGGRTLGDFRRNAMAVAASAKPTGGSQPPALLSAARDDAAAVAAVVGAGFAAAAPSYAAASAAESLLLGPRARAALLRTWRRFVASPECQEVLVTAFAAALGDAPAAKTL